jgi:hypothetical protein
VVCSTLAHGIKEIHHPYFGTNKIVEDLSRMEGWAEGLVSINNDDFVREKSTHKVCGIKLK